MVDHVEAGYQRAEAITRRAGRTYYLASRLLPSGGARAVFALYAYARLADDIVDEPAPGITIADQTARLDALEAGLFSALDANAHIDLPAAEADVVAALADSVRRFAIPTDTFIDFGRSMRMDLPGHPLFRNRYASFAELAEYTYGSAAVIGIQLLPILGVDRDNVETTAGAELLGEAFQLTNFLRDVAEDAARDRIYLPADQLAAFGVDDTRLMANAATGHADSSVRRAVKHFIAVNRDQYRRAAPAIEALPHRTRPAIRAAARSYSAILTEIERLDGDVFSRRAVVPMPRRLAHAAASLVTGLK
ncbi:MAG: phytoene/squalene synthase family protein [Gordonia sp. (in: high G+C Gram-positive bacteria)]|uniref:phytoene/squalene synthase family protein n=1 Tax=Gordonia sp. (in: high G+C Gram-positive bacteria) TaxID=84139 RepID=UPI003C790CA6